VRPPEESPRTPHARRRLAAAGIVLALVGSLACSGPATPAAPDRGRDADVDPQAALHIAVASGPAEYVTGGDAVIAIDSPAGLALDGVVVSVDGTDVTGRFSPDTSTYRGADAAPRLLGTLTGLPEGTSTVSASLGDHDASLELVDHPVAGPPV
jgi:hypothetical protein